MDVIKRGFDSNVFTRTTLLTMYVKCSCIEFACEAFDKMCERDVISLNALIAGYDQCGRDV
jgi:pentatricopeptide repeat protein